MPAGRCMHFNIRRNFQLNRISLQAREVINEEMETYVKASLTKDVTFTVASPNAATDSRFYYCQQALIIHQHIYI